MATIHIADISTELSSLLAHIRKGDRVVIEENKVAIAVLSAPEPATHVPMFQELLTYSTARSANANSQHRTLSEAIRFAEERGSIATLDDQFGSDLEEVLRLHQQETLRDPWE